jgi:peptidoglycan/LPS O-acetylase OafA/YrhL
MPSRLANIDALRGFAALWVFAYHLWNVFAPGYSQQGTFADRIPLNADTPLWVWLTFPLCGFGYTGVGLFFVLSGFCIHLPHARRHQKTGADDLQPRAFFQRRFRRLYPAYFASLFVSAAGLLAMTSTMAGATPPPLATVGVFAMVNAFFLLALRPDALGLNGVYWTLWYEVQFYLAYPLLLKICRRVGFGGIAAALLAVELLFTFVPTPDVLKPIAPHFEWLFLRRYFEWFLGMWLAERVANGQHLPRWVSLGAAVLAGAGGVWGGQVPELWPVHELLLAIASAGLVSLLVAPAAEPAAGGVRARVKGVFGWFGDCSYSLYLIHMPVLRLIFAVEAILPEDVRQLGTFQIAGAIGVFLVPTSAYLWYRLFEKPFMPKPTSPPAGARGPRPASQRPAAVVA